MKTVGEIWQEGLTVDGVNITPAMLTEIYRQMKVVNGRRIFEASNFEFVDDCPIASVEELTDEQAEQISEKLDDILNCDSSNDEYEAVRQVLTA